MLLNAPGSPTKTKHAIYLVSTTIMGLFLGILTHVVVESVYLEWAVNAGRQVTWYAGCSLHPLIQIGLLAVGAVGGFLLGIMWWRLVYIERKWAAGFTKK